MKNLINVFNDVATFIESAKANGVDVFFSYSPHVGGITFSIYKGGKWTEDNEIESMFKIYLNEFDEHFKQVVETVIDKYYLTDIKNETI